MKKIEIVLAAVTLTAIVGFVYILLFVGWGSVLSGNSPHSYNPSPPPDDATLWEKAYWEKYHGNVYQCGWFAEFVEPVVLYSSTGSAISNISFRFAQMPGEQPHEIATISYTFSTRSAMKTVRYGDPSVNVTWLAWNRTPALSPADLTNTRVEDNELVAVDLDVATMGIDASAVGPNQKFVLVITPADDCIRETTFRGKIPLVILPGSRMEIRHGY